MYTSIYVLFYHAIWRFFYMNMFIPYKCKNSFLVQNFDFMYQDIMIPLDNAMDHSPNIMLNHQTKKGLSWIKISRNWHSNLIVISIQPRILKKQLILTLLQLLKESVSLYSCTTRVPSCKVKVSLDKESTCVLNSVYI